MLRAGFSFSEPIKKIGMQRPGFPFSLKGHPHFREKYPLGNVGRVWLAPPGVGVLWRALEHREGASGTFLEPLCPAAGDMSGTAFTLSPQMAPAPRPRMATRLAF